MRVHWTHVFERTFEEALKKYPSSSQETRNHIEALADNPVQGDPYPGIVPPARKLRMPLKAYRIGKSRGLRLVFMILEVVIPVFIYKKGEFDETEIVRRIRTAIKDITAEISA